MRRSFRPLRFGIRSWKSIGFDPPVELIRTGDLEADITTNTQKFTSIIEGYVRRYPEQWLWVHRRWKTRPPGAAPLY